MTSVDCADEYLERSGESEGEIEQERTGEMVEVECIQVNWLITCNVVTSLECRITTNQFYSCHCTSSCLSCLWDARWKITYPIDIQSYYLVENWIFFSIRTKRHGVRYHVCTVILVFCSSRECIFARNCQMSDRKKKKNWEKRRLVENKNVGKWRECYANVNVRWCMKWKTDTRGHYTQFAYIERYM